MGVGREGGSRGRGDIHIYIHIHIWLIWVAVWQKPTQPYKAVFLQLKNKREHKKKILSSFSILVTLSSPILAHQELGWNILKFTSDAPLLNLFFSNYFRTGDTLTTLCVLVTWHCTLSPSLQPTSISTLLSSHLCSRLQTACQGIFCLA